MWKERLEKEGNIGKQYPKFGIYFTSLMEIWHLSGKLLIQILCLNFTFHKEYFVKYETNKLLRCKEANTIKSMHW